MSERGHEWSGNYEIAMRRLQDHIRRAADGTFLLDVEDAGSINVDPIVFADLKRSLEETNRKIRRGEINPQQIESYLP
jgi:hypothetical protein